MSHESADRRIAMSMEQQADEIRKKAVAQLICGVVSGAINIGMGAVQFGMGMKQLSATKGQAKGQQELNENQLNKETRALEKQQHAQQKELNKITKDIDKHGSRQRDGEIRGEKTAPADDRQAKQEPCAAGRRPRRHSQSERCGAAGFGNFAILWRYGAVHVPARAGGKRASSVPSGISSGRSTTPP